MQLYNIHCTIYSNLIALAHNIIFSHYWPLNVKVVLQCGYIYYNEYNNTGTKITWSVFEIKDSYRVNRNLNGDKYQTLETKSEN